MGFRITRSQHNNIVVPNQCYNIVMLWSPQWYRRSQWYDSGDTKFRQKSRNSVTGNWIRFLCIAVNCTKKMNSSKLTFHSTSTSYVPRDLKYLAGLDGVAAADAFARFLDPFGFVGGGAAASAGRTSCAGSLVTASSYQHQSKYCLSYTESQKKHAL